MRISSPEAMHQLGRDLAQKAKVLLLSGELGAGKTTLIKGFAEALGIDPEKVQSPTYAYLNLYDGKLLHIDMYRLGSFEELVEKGILSQIAECEWVVIEWPKWIDQLDLEAPLQLEIEKISASEREVKGV
ncbi:MAG: tRNA (adenosine(37)-N6)-threonylcarbamoyltransferase complex ATPase subunit type 1 TsaE [candidate division SR1 bacterium]|nr:MAG: tRNA (adenosine(37)-N6)-threonylcarbamoyltransferase complex ATPase subunit type 1 TsaE [candidate division SR1 bacterium]